MIDYTNPDAENYAGAIPNLNAKHTEVLGTPEGQTKGKTNVNKLIALAAGVLGLCILIAGAVWFTKNRADTKAANPAPVAKVGVKAEADSETMAKRQAALKKKTAEDEAQAVIANAELERQKALMAQIEAVQKGKANPNQPYMATPADNQRAAAAYAANAQKSAPVATSPAPSPVSTSSAAPAPVPVVITPDQRKMSGCVLFGCKDVKEVVLAKPAASGGSSLNLAASSSNSANSNANAANQGQGVALSTLYEPTVLSSRTATQLDDLTYLLTKGAVIPCGLKTEIDTTLPGIVICQTTKDIYSANGKLLLIERGSKVIGEQRQGLAQGQERVFALWTRIDTPKGVSINIDSPITGSLGASGAPAYVDTHFWERFGAAIMLSLMDGVNFNITSPYTIGTPVGYITPSVSNGTGSANSSNGASKSIATEAFKNSTNIPPTGHINAGTVVNVMVARDVSFKGVYGLFQ